MTVHPDHVDPKSNHSHINFRDFFQLPLDVDCIDDIINTQMMKPPHIILLRLEALGDGINPDIGTVKKDRGEIFSECYTELFKAKFLRYVNEVLFEMVKQP